MVDETFDNQFNLSYKQIKGGKLHDKLNICRKGIWQNSTHIWRLKKTLPLGIKVNLIKDNYEKPTANTINGWKLPLKIGNKARMCTPSLPLGIILEILLSALSKEK